MSIICEYDMQEANKIVYRQKFRLNRVEETVKRVLKQKDLKSTRRLLRVWLKELQDTYTIKRY